MKKTLLLITLAFTFAIYSCGPSAEEKAAAEKATQDSIAQVVADSVKKVMDDSLATVQKAIDDSISKARMVAMEDSLAKMKETMNKPKPKAKPKPDNAQTTTPQVGHKKPGAK